jgi:hypothetical protein
LRHCLDGAERCLHEIIIVARGCTAASRFETGDIGASGKNSAVSGNNDGSEARITLRVVGKPSQRVPHRSRNRIAPAWIAQGKVSNCCSTLDTNFSLVFHDAACLAL